MNNAGICSEKVTLAKAQSTQSVSGLTQIEIVFPLRALRLCEKIVFILFVVGIVAIIQPAQAELLTLFTTAQERQIINANRYKSDKVVTRPIQALEPEIEEIQQLIQEEVQMSYSVTGITISDSGPNTVWINNQVFEEGEHLEDNIHFKVITGNDIKVRITTPDGQHYFATSGETIDVTYMVSASN